MAHVDRQRLQLTLTRTGAPAQRCKYPVVSLTPSMQACAQCHPPACDFLHPSPSPQMLRARTLPVCMHFPIHTASISRLIRAPVLLKSATSLLILLPPRYCHAPQAFLLAPASRRTAMKPAAISFTSTGPHIGFAQEQSPVGNFQNPAAILRTTPITRTAVTYHPLQGKNSCMQGPLRPLIVVDRVTAWERAQQPWGGRSLGGHRSS